MRRCSRCILPETYPEIDFDADGVCNYCRRHQAFYPKGPKALDRILDRFRGKHPKYDCVLGVSGAGDSTYALIYLVRVCGLRVLAYFSDHEYVSEQARKNVAAVCAKLNVELIVSASGDLKRCFPHNLRAWLKRPSPAMVPMICCGCRLGVFRGLFECARKNKVSLIVLGSGDPAEICRFKQIYLRTAPWTKVAGKRHEAAALSLGLANELFLNPRYFLTPVNFWVGLQEYAYCFLLKILRRWFYPGQERLDFYQYIPWDASEMKEVLRKELGWNDAPEGSGSWRTGCQLSAFKNYLLQTTAGFSEYTECFSNMIRANRISRETALAKLAAAESWFLKLDPGLSEMIESRKACGVLIKNHRPGVEKPLNG